MKYDNSDDEQLVQAAKKAAENSYSPYSNFPVGAAVITEDGEIFTGTNIENISFGLTICAERVAVFNAVTCGKRDIKAVAVYTSKDQLITPCGACRQVLFEFAPNCKVIFANQTRQKVNILSDLLPEAFETLVDKG